MRRRSGSSVVSTVGVLAVLLLSASAATAQDGGDAAPDNPYFETGAEPGSGVGTRIGYISLGEDDGFVSIVTEGIREQAAVAGVELVFCDSRFDAEEALICARQMAGQGVQGILNFQFSEADAGRICAAHGGLPTIAIDIDQQPCQRSFVGVDNRRAGLVTGIAIGEYLQEERGCDYDNLFVLQSLDVGRVGTDRTGGMVDGFAEICGPVPDEKLHDIDVFGGYEPALEIMSAMLAGLPAGGTHVVLGINQNVAFGALDAARALGRVDELRVGSQGAEVLKTQIACEEQWVAATAYFPERYGHILIPAMIDLLDGEEIPGDLFVPHVAVTAENIRDVYADVPDCEVESEAA